jgi:hypothetical protein
MSRQEDSTMWIAAAPWQPQDSVAISRASFPFVALLAAALVAALLIWSGPVAAQAPESKEPPPPTDVVPKPFEESILRRIFPEPQSNFLTLSPQLPAGGVPLLRRIPGVAEEMDKLPSFLRDTSLNVHFRTFYFDRLNSDGSTNEAWAFGGWLAYKSGWLADTFAIGAVGYTSQPLYAPNDTPGTLLLHPPQDSLLMIGQAYGQVRYKEYFLLTGGRQIDDEGYLNPNDGRMIPNTFEAVTATGRLGPVGYEVGYYWTMKGRQENDFHNMAKQAGVSGENRGLILTRLSAEPIQGLMLYGANYLVPDVFNTVYGNAEYTLPVTTDLSVQMGVQYTDQRNVGEAFLGNFNTWNVSTRALVLWRGITAGAVFSATGDEAALLTPYGTYPGYMSFQERDFDRAREKAWGVGGKYDFGKGTLLGDFRLPGVVAGVRYAEGTDAINPSTGAGLPRVREGDLDITWNIPWVQGLQFRFRNAYVAESGQRVLQGFRLILNYELPLL